MAKMHIKQILARNLKGAMERKYNGIANQSQLSRDTQNKVSPKTISNYLSANRFQTGDPQLESIPSPTLSLLAEIADVLRVDVWELVHPNPGAVSGKSTAGTSFASSEIIELLTFYSRCNKTGRDMIMATAKGAAEVHAQSLTPANDQLESG